MIPLKRKPFSFSGFGFFGNWIFWRRGRRRADNIKEQILDLFCGEELSNGVSRSKAGHRQQVRACVLELWKRSLRPSPPSKSGGSNRGKSLRDRSPYFEPRPLQAGQAPYGELKLKERGSENRNADAAIGAGRVFRKRRVPCRRRRRR